VAGRLGGQVTLYVIYIVHVETMGAGFLVEPQTNVDNLLVVLSQNN
jgi:hypothetical protein